MFRNRFSTENAVYCVARISLPLNTELRDLYSLFSPQANQFIPTPMYLSAFNLLKVYGYEDAFYGR